MIPTPYRCKSTPQLGATTPGELGSFGVRQPDEPQDITRDLADAVNERLDELKAAAIERKQARRAYAIQKAARRNFGLAARHAQKIARTATEKTQGDHE